MVADRAPLVRHCSACSSFCWSVTAVTDLSARAMVTDPSVVCRSFAPRPSDRPSLLVCPLLRLLVHHWPVACLSAGPSLLVRCWHIVGLPACPSLAVTVLYLFVVAGLSPRPSPPVSSSVSSSIARRWSVAGPSLVCRWSITGPSPRPSLVTGRSARVRVAAPWLVCCSSVTYPWLVMVARASARSSRVALPLLRLLVHHWPVSSSVAFLSAVRSPVCLLEPWSLARRSSICCPSLLRLLES